MGLFSPQGSADVLIYIPSLYLSTTRSYLPLLSDTSFLRSMPPEHPSPTLVLAIVELSFHSPRLSIPLFRPCLLHWESRHGTTSSSFELDSSVRVQYCIFLILLKYTWFTMFQVYCKMVQLYRRVCVCVCVCIFFRFFSIVGYHKMLTAVPCAVQVFVVYLFYTQQCVFANPKLLIYPSTPFPLW